MKRVPFDVRFLFRQLIRGGGKTWILFLSSGIAAMLLLMMVSTKPFLVNLLETEASDKYGSLDLIVTYDANSNRRILNQRVLATDYADIGEWSTFFNAAAYAVDRTVQVFGGPDGGMRFLTDATHFPIDGDELFVTASLASQWNVGVGDFVTLYLKGVPYEYQVVGVEPDHGLFSGDAVYLDKTALLAKLFSLEGLSNLGNTIYFRLADPTSIDEWTARLQAESEFTGFRFVRVMDPDTFERIANYTASILFGAMLFGLLAVFVVIRSVVPLYHREFAHQAGVVKPLGAPSGWIERRWMALFAIIGLLALPLGLTLDVLVFHFGKNAYGIQSPVPFPILWLIFGSILFLVLFLFLAWIEIRHFQSLSAINAARDKRGSISRYSPFVAVFALIALVVSKGFLTPFKGWQSALMTIFGLVLVMEWIPSVFGLLNRMLSKKRPSYFRLVSAPWLASAKPIHGAIRVTFLAMVVIASSLSIVTFVTTETDAIVAQSKTDYLMANVFDYDDEVKNTLLSYDGIDSVYEAILFERTSMWFEDGEKTFRFHLSMSEGQWSAAFDFPIEGNETAFLEETDRLLAAVPISIAKSMNLEIGDQIELDSGSALGRLTYEVAGFLDINYDNLILTNLSQHTTSRAVQSVNALFLDGTPSQALYDRIATDFGARMDFMVPMTVLLDSITRPILGAIRFVVLVALVVVAAFGVVVWNNARMVFHQFRPDYARVRILGLSKNELMVRVAFEFLTISAALIVTGLFAAAFLLPLTNDAMLVFGFYKEIHYPLARTFAYTLPGVALFWLSFLSVAVGIAKLQPIQEIKQA